MNSVNKVVHHAKIMKLAMFVLKIYIYIGINLNVDLSNVILEIVISVMMILKILNVEPVKVAIT